MIVVGILVATVVAFIISFAFYAVAPAAPAAGDTAPARPRTWQIIVELLRSAITATLVTGLLVAGAWSGLAAGALLGPALRALPVGRPADGLGLGERPGSQRSLAWRRLTDQAARHRGHRRRLRLTLVPLRLRAHSQVVWNRPCADDSCGRRSRAGRKGLSTSVNPTGGAAITR